MLSASYTSLMIRFHRIKNKPPTGWRSLPRKATGTLSSFWTDWTTISPPAVLLSATRLLHHMSRVFQETPPPSNPTGPRVDSKLMQRIREKKITAGHKAESQTLSYCKEAFMEVRPPTQIPVRFPFCALDPANHKLPTYKIAGFPHDPRLSPKRVP